MTGSRNKIIHILAETKAYVSGESISHQLGISRAGVWKHIKQLREDGYEIDSVRNKGHKLLAYPKDFVAEELEGMLKDLSFVDVIQVHDSIDSTNEEAKRLANKYPDKTVLVISEEQTAGKGRRGRQWTSKQGVGIYMSLLMHPDIPTHHASQLTLLAGLAVNEALQDITARKTMIKWPNDIVYKGRKICGILTEMSTEVNEIDFVVVGIGINVNQNRFPKELQDIATSVRLLTGHSSDRKQLVKIVIENFHRLYELFQRTGSLGFMIDEYNENCTTVASDIQIESRGILSYGHCNKVLENGGLEVVMDGKVKTIHSGEVSVRGLYGYVE